MDRGLHGIGAVYPLAQGELIEDQIVPGVQLPVRDLVVERQGQLALADRVAGELAGVRAGGRELDVLEGDLRVDEEILGQRIGLPGDLEGPGTIYRGAEIHVGGGTRRG